MAEYDSRYTGKEVDDAVAKILTGGVGIAGEVPLHGIVIYSGLIRDIPIGWVLCDGANGVPNLINRFVMGTTIQSEIKTIGGNADAVVVKHKHTETPHTHAMTHTHTATASDGSHTHSQITYGDTTAPSGHGANIKVKGNRTDVVTGGSHTHTVTMTDFTGNTQQNTDKDTTESGVDGVGLNLPPFMKLAYIIRIS